MNSKKQTKNYLGRPYTPWYEFLNSDNRLFTYDFYCSKLIWRIYYNVNSDCNLSTWYEFWPTPNSIFRDGECLVLSGEIKSNN